MHDEIDASYNTNGRNWKYIQNFRWKN